MRPARPDDFRLPDLRFVPVQSLVPHEQHDLQRMRPLIQGFREQAVLKNPPIVALLPGSPEDAPRYMVLDGANRATAAREAGLPHIVVQVARYEDPWVHLSTWHHALSEATRDDLLGSCKSIRGLECRDEALLSARAQVARREALAYAVHEGEVVTVFRGGTTLEERNQLLNAIVDTYRESRRFYRMSTESFEVAKERHPDVRTLVVFPHFDPAEVVELATSGALLPAGVTRHLIRWRALRVNVPMDRMTDTKLSLEQKNRWLETWLAEKWTQRQVRFYEEPTVLFDE
jgi:hypothetical protein